MDGRDIQGHGGLRLVVAAHPANGVAVTRATPDGIAFAAAFLDGSGRCYGAVGHDVDAPGLMARLSDRAGVGRYCPGGDLSNALRRLGIAPGGTATHDDLPDLRRDRDAMPARVAAFGRLLRGDVLDLLSGTHSYGTSAYDHYAVAGPMGSDRRRVARAFPGFTDVIRSEPVSRSLETGISLRNGLDAFCRGAVGTRDGSGLGSGHLRRLRQADWEPMGLESKRRVLGMMAHLPPNWMPGSPDEAAAARDLEPLHAALTRMLGVAGPAFSGCGGRWGDFLAHAVRTTGLGPAALRTAADAMSQASRDVAARVVLPCLAHADGNEDLDVAATLALLVPTVDRLLYRDRSLAACMAILGRWHRAQFGPPPLADGTGTETWPALSRPWAATGGETVVPLNDGDMLASEGSALGHCVGAYRFACASGASHIVSVRLPPDEGGVAVSTAEFDLGYRGALRLRQHRGPGNAAPGDRARAVLAAYQEAIAERRLELDEDAVRLSDAFRVASGDVSLDATCGFDWRDPAALSRMVRAYDAVLPPGLRGMVVGEWTERTLRVALKPNPGSLLVPRIPPDEEAIALDHA